MNEWISKRTYVAPTPCLAVHRLNSRRDRVRNEAIWFANRELDPDRVLSISETTTLRGLFSVTVWYRSDEERAETIYMTSADLHAPVGVLTKALADAPAMPDLVFADETQQAY